MIERYTNPEMGNIWSDQAKYQTWLDVEIAACVAWNKYGIIPDNDLKMIKKAKFSLDSYNKWFDETKHDLISFTRSVSESLGDEGRWIHHGLTSNDVKDTALSIQMSQAVDVIEKSLILMMSALKKKALKYKKLPCVGLSLIHI